MCIIEREFHGSFVARLESDLRSRRRRRRHFKRKYLRLLPSVWRQSDQNFTPIRDVTRGYGYRGRLIEAEDKPGDPVIGRTKCCWITNYGCVSYGCGKMAVCRLDHRYTHTTGTVRVSGPPLVASQVLPVHDRRHRSSRSMGQPEEKYHTF